MLQGHHLQDGNLIPFEAICHGAPCGNLQGEKLLNKSKKNEGGFWPQLPLCANVCSKKKTKQIKRKTQECIVFS